MLILVVANHKYEDRVPVQIGTQVIDQLVATMTNKELQKAGKNWRQVCLSSIVSKRNTIGSPMLLSIILEEKKGKICTMREVVAPPLATTVVTGMVDKTTHSKILVLLLSQL